MLAPAFTSFSLTLLLFARLFTAFAVVLMSEVVLVRVPFVGAFERELTSVVTPFWITRSGRKMGVSLVDTSSTEEEKTEESGRGGERDAAAVAPRRPT